MNENLFLHNKTPSLLYHRLQSKNLLIALPFRPFIASLTPSPNSSPYNVAVSVFRPFRRCCSRRLLWLLIRDICRNSSKSSLRFWCCRWQFLLRGRRSRCFDGLQNQTLLFRIVFPIPKRLFNLSL